MCGSGSRTVSSSNSNDCRSRSASASMGGTDSTPSAPSSSARRRTTNCLKAEAFDAALSTDSRRVPAERAPTIVAPAVSRRHCARAAATQRSRTDGSSSTAAIATMARK